MSRPTANFDGHDFAASVPGLEVIATDPYRFPNRELNTSPLANSDKSVNSSAYYKDKKLNVRVEIGRNTRELLDDSIDTLYSILQGRAKALVLSYGSSTRQWYATLANVAFTDILGGHATLDIEFECADPIGTDVNSTSLFSTALTGANSTTSFVVGGSADWQKPIITITLSALTGGTGASVVIGNPANGQQITITGDFTAGDVLVIDARVPSVKLNGAEVAWSGAIPEWASGVGSMDYSDTLTTRTRSMVGIYYKRYI